ncbi:MAG: hypothetical protein EPO12_21455 [Aquabacterium sp.]|nr:MAG: hypothetical protein EPO12_21455 [Aquabacterium sp.]
MRDPISDVLRDYRRRHILQRIARNRGLARIGAMLLFCGMLVFVSSRLFDEMSTWYVRLALGGGAVVGLGLLGLVASSRWNREDKCPECGKLFWGTRSKTGVGFLTHSRSCLHCGHVPSTQPDDADRTVRS